MYTVGQLSKHTGVSIRTLHYYEKLGLLRPARNENNQYRLYGEKDIMRLQQITILKKMHFKLNEIGEFLDQDAAHSAPESTLTLWNHTLEQQMAVVKEQQERLSKVEHLLFSTIYAIRASGRINLDEMMGFIRELDQPPGRSRRDVFTPEEIESLPLNNQNNSLSLEWADILKEIHTCKMEPADSEASRLLAIRIYDYAERAFQGNAELAEKYWDYIAPADDQPARVYGMTTETMHYIETILDRWTVENPRGQL
ncbi:MerR family transcriptional regulator [Paenibacillus sp. USHLN196]|uniref:MerR family transcriptional regulator n=1 Tax=Paenibacillus sp. USHLN196 TaxID=3081291 RepID=UPI003016C242